MKNSIRFPFFLLLLTLFAAGCGSGTDRKSEIAKQVEVWQNKTVLFPQGDVFTLLGKDTVEVPLSEKPYKVLVYTDSIGCTSCKLQLPKWKEMINEVDSITGGMVEFCFYFHPKDYKEVCYILKREGFDLPVCIDTEDRLNRLNRFPSESTFQTFLLDRNNKVVALGNPVNNHKVKELYLKQIQGGEYKEKPANVTQAEPNVSHINMGTFKETETRSAVFYLRNSGNVPLLILDTRTTCGCTTAKYDKHPASPGDSLRVELIYTPDKKTFFSKSATLICNTSQPVYLTINGEVN